MIYFRKLSAAVRSMGLGCAGSGAPFQPSNYRPMSTTLHANLQLNHRSLPALLLQTPVPPFASMTSVPPSTAAGARGSSGMTNEAAAAAGANDTTVKSSGASLPKKGRLKMEQYAAEYLAQCQGGEARETYD